MATINSRKTVDEIIARGGKIPGDAPIVKIVQYNNMFDGGLAYGLVYRGEDKMRYERGGACINPVVVWEVTK